MTLNELKKENSRAHSSLISMWAELSRISEKMSRIDLKENMGSRYIIDKNDDELVFNDTHAGDIFIYDEMEDDWDMK